jgi:hypothetical protein
VPRFRSPPLLALLALACGSPPPAPESRDADPVARGGALYQSHGCIACHGPEGRGDGLLAGSLDPKPRDLHDPASYRQGHSAEEISHTLGMGLLGPGVSPMPSYPHLSRADKDALAAWVVTLQATPPGGAIRVRDGWVRAAPPGARVTAAYLTLENPGPQQRVLESVSAEGFEVVEIHETREQDGVARMRPVSRLAVPAGERVELAPGGFHLMLIGPDSPAAEGEQRRLALRFDDGSATTVRLPVRRAPEAGT